jgi:hypothetical protein
MGDHSVEPGTRTRSGSEYAVCPRVEPLIRVVSVGIRSWILAPLPFLALHSAEGLSHSRNVLAQKPRVSDLIPQ